MTWICSVRRGRVRRGDGDDGAGGADIVEVGEEGEEVEHGRGGGHERGLK